MKSLVLGKLEQEVISIIWNSNTPLSVRNVLELLKGDYAYTTVMTVMTRLEKKRLLKRVAKGNLFLYTYTQNKSTYANKHLNSIFDSLVNTYGELAISQFVDSIKKDEKNIRLLEDFLNK